MNRITYEILSDMNKSDAKKKIEKLCKALEHHNRQYYLEAMPEISDFEYDRLMRELSELEAQFPDLKSNSSPTQRVGGAPLKSFKTIAHRIPMLSLDNTYSAEELIEFDKRIKKFLNLESVEYFVEEKIDGVSISLSYEKGSLVLGATRGDGKQGDDITENLKTIDTIPLKINSGAAKLKVPKVLELRGEAYISHEQFDLINQEKEKVGEELFANPRNSCAGSLKLLDPKLVRQRKLKAFIHGIGYVEGGNPFKSQSEMFDFIRSLGFPVIENTQKCRDIESVQKFIAKFQEVKNDLDYDTDGMVVKVNDFALQKALGTTTKAPRYMIAYKYPAEKAETILENIRIQVGRTGVLTPVADLKPVRLSGSTVSRASLHNQDEIERLDARIGDYVLVEKSGEIIPKVVEVLKEKRKEALKKFIFPKNCPVCGEKVEQSGDEVAVRCLNMSCAAQIKGRVRHFASRDAMDIEGLGTVWVEQFVDQGLIKDLSDIYYLNFDQVLNLERMGQKSTENLFKGIEESKSRPLNRLIYGLGILDVGEHSAHILAQKFGHLEKLAQADHKDLESIREIGPVTAQSIVSFFREASTRKTLDKLKKAGVKFDWVEKVKTTTVFAGKSFVITGTLESFERSKAEALIRSLGGHPSGSVSKKTNFLIAGESAGSKLEKAKELGIEILSEKDFLKMLRASGVEV